MKIGCILLAGGEGSRFGRDKAWIELNGQTLLQRAVSKVGLLASEIIIVTAKGRVLPPLSASVRVSVVYDLVAGRGPLMGIYTGLLNSTFQHNLVMACDMPFVSEKLIEYMVTLVDEYDAVVPVKEEYREPLCAIYSQTCLAVIEDIFNDGATRINDLLNRIKVRFVNKPEIEFFDPELLSFFNINSNDDLIQAEMLSWGKMRDI